MTRTEAEAVARVISTADNGCETCIRNLAEELNGERLGFMFLVIRNIDGDPLVVVSEVPTDQKGGER